MRVFRERLVHDARYQKVQQFGGEGGIRTLGTGYPVRQISNLVPSTTRPPLRAQESAHYRTLTRLREHSQYRYRSPTCLLGVLHRESLSRVFELHWSASSRNSGPVCKLCTLGVIRAPDQDSLADKERPRGQCCEAVKNQGADEWRQMA